MQGLQTGQAGQIRRARYDYGLRLSQRTERGQLRVGDRRAVKRVRVACFQDFQHGPLQGLAARAEGRIDRRGGEGTRDGDPRKTEQASAQKPSADGDPLGRVGAFYSKRT